MTLDLSKKAIALPASPIRKLVPYSDRAKEEGVTVYHLNIGQPDIEAPHEAIEALATFKSAYIPYSHSAGDIGLRERLAAYYQDKNLRVDTEDVLITTGGSEALIFAFTAICNEGDEIIIPEPFYANYNTFAIQTGVKIVPITTHIETNFSLPDIHQFENLITSKTKAILICNPNNPTGYVYSKEELERLAELALKHNLYLISDEVYAEFCYTQAPHFSMLHLDAIQEHVIVIDSFSKRYSLCGVRIGAVITKNKALQSAFLKLAQARLSPPALGQFLAFHALSAPKSYFTTVHQEYLKRRDYITQRLSAMKGVQVSQAFGAFYVIARLPVAHAESFCIWLLEHFRHQNSTVMLAPANGFYASPNLGTNEVRLAYVLEHSALEQAMDCLEEGLKQYH